MVDSERKPRWYHPTPDRIAVAVLLAQGGLVLGDRFYLFGLRRGDLGNIKLAAGLVVGMLGLGLLWLPIGLVLRRPCQFGIRWLMLLTLTVAVPSSWYAVWKEQGRQQKQALLAVKKTQARIESQGKAHRQPRYGTEPIAKKPGSGSRELIVGISFAIEEDLGCGCCYGDESSDISDEDLAPLAHFHGLERLELPDGEITDAGLVHLRNLKNLRYLDLTGNPITDEGLAHLGGLKNLEHLLLSRTDITDASFVHLGRLTNLERLDFGRTHATGEGVKHLVACKAFKQCGPKSVPAGPHAATLDPKGFCAFSELPDLEELHAAVNRSGATDATIEFDGHRKLRGLGVANGTHLDSIRLANLPELEDLRLVAGPCNHVVQYGSKGPMYGSRGTCSTCTRCVNELRLENLPKLKSLQAADVKRLALREVPNLKSLEAANVEQLALREVPNLTHATLRGVVTAEHFRQLGRSTRLEHVSITATTLPGDEFLFCLGSQPRLERLTITGLELSDRALAALVNFPALKSLSLREAELSGNHLAHLRHLKSLERLELRDIADAGQPLACLSELKQLKQLVVSRSEIGTLSLADMPNLDSLEIDACRIGTLEVANLPMLKHLDTGSGTFALRLLAKRLPQLESLYMQFGKGKEPLRHVELERLPKLATLSMTGDWKRPLLGDEGFEHLDTFTNLWKIELGNSRVTDRTIDRMMKLPRLQRVDLHNTRTTETAADRLRANGPEGIEVRQSGPRK